MVLIVASCVATVLSYNTSLTTCGSPSNPQATSEYECTGALFNLVDINALNALKTESGCVAVMTGFSTQLQGYHCLSFKNCPGDNCMCEVRQGCASGAAAAPATTKACLYGIQQASACPADVAASGPDAGSPTSSASSQSYSAVALGSFIVAVYVGAVLSQ